MLSYLYKLIKMQKTCFESLFHYMIISMFIYSKDRATSSKATMPIDRDDEEAMLQEATSSKGVKVPSEVPTNNKRVVDAGSSKDKAKKSCAKIKRFKVCKKT